ncbi:peptidoglycan DD-metalloendopeptidase family protein [Streptomyces sp. HMX87]|uniref:peptidoglycan DD-metalloendopeptidase family protein n=1 Tax=Streptomyces sp. HMX87 TaxID=3390849 RepID=UPI003A87F47E
MNDRHPSGTMTPPASASDAASAPYGAYGTQEAQYGDLTTYGGHHATGFVTGTPAPASFESDPLFGSLPGQNTGTYETAPYDATGTYETAGSYDGTGSYDTGQWSTGAHETLNSGTHESLTYDTYGTQQHTGYGTTAYDTGAYDTAAWTAEYQQLPVVPSQGTGPDTSGQWDATAWMQPDQSGNPADRTQQWAWDTQSFDTGTLDATQWNTDGASEHGTAPPSGDRPTDTGELPTVTGPLLLDDQEETSDSGSAADASGTADAPTDPRSPRSPRSRRRQPAKRSALLTIAVPSACVMGVAGIAAASVGTLGGEESTDAAASTPDRQPVKPSAANNKLDTQLAIVSAGATDFADRASRTQERIDLKAQQEAEKKRAAEEAARKERLRPKFALPVAQHGLSAYYGQSGINWMSVHSGIDFPVSYGTPVLAATDGTVRTQWNSAYGNMMIVTAKDGTETWYCHLSSYRVPSGTVVKAGDPIAYSGNSGNSTGPHLHFEVRPGGGSAIDPLSWLRSHGLDPT